MTYLYCEAKDQTTIALTGTVLKQLLAQLPSLPINISEFYVKLTSKNETPNIDQLLALTSNVCALYDDVFLVVDALDECQVRASFLPILSQLNRAGVKVLVTSRPYKPDIVDFFEDSARLDIIAADDDIEGYVAEQISCNFKYKDIAKRLSADMKTTIISTITKSAQGL